MFTRRKLAVFIDGCYWHGCPEHGARAGGLNAAYWGPKIARNRERDLEHTALLESAGWRVLRFWEHEQPATIVAAVAAAVIGDRPGC